ncbi:MAG: hypothetical protein ACI9V1_001327 [Spirosomataceae bacterium]|jgi:hypothetical protein
MEFLVFILALGLGGIAAWQIFNWTYARKLKDNRSNELKVESNILLDKIEKVFKVIMTEGYFTEIYDHNSSKDLLGLGLFQSNKKALVIAKAKVSIGFDFAKMESHRDEYSRKLIIDKFPDAEILSIDTDYKFYDINQGWLHKFNNEDYTEILTEAKKMMQVKAKESDLPAIAHKQMNVMMTQLASAMNWEIDIKVPTKLIEKTAKSRSFIEFDKIEKLETKSRTTPEPTQRGFV